MASGATQQVDSEQMRVLARKFTDQATTVDKVMRQGVSTAAATTLTGGVRAKLDEILSELKTALVNMKATSADISGEVTKKATQFDEHFAG